MKRRKEFGEGESKSRLLPEVPCREPFDDLQRSWNIRHSIDNLHVLRDDLTRLADALRESFGRDDR
jgi:hypothetical protein